jgi:hypothetical protein
LLQPVSCACQTTKEGGPQEKQWSGACGILHDDASLKAFAPPAALAPLFTAQESALHPDFPFADGCGTFNALIRG